jgi:hypothetical protein
MDSQARCRGIKRPDKRPHPRNLIISNLVTSRLGVQTPYLIIQSDGVVIQQKHLASINASA